METKFGTKCEFIFISGIESKSGHISRSNLTSPCACPHAPVRLDDPEDDLSKAQGGHGIDNGAEAESKDIWLQSVRIGSIRLQSTSRRWGTTTKASERRKD